MKLLILASHAWSEQVDHLDLENVLDHLLASLVNGGPIQVHVPSDRPTLVRKLRDRGWDLTEFTPDQGPPAKRYHRAFFLSPSPLTTEAQAWLDQLFTTLADVWVVVHVPPGSRRAVVQVSGQEEGRRPWSRPLDWDLSDTELDQELEAQPAMDVDAAKRGPEPKAPVYDYTSWDQVSALPDHITDLATEDDDDPA